MGGGVGVGNGVGEGPGVGNGCFSAKMVSNADTGLKMKEDRELTSTVIVPVPAVAVNILPLLIMPGPLCTL